MIRSLYSTFFVLLVCSVFSQEGLKPLRSNFSYIYKDLNPQPTKQSTSVSNQKTAAAGDTLTLPFVEDFYYSSTSYYPDQKKWTDSTVYVNSGMAIAPLSIGVATFDGLNKHGYPYNPTLINLATSQPADTLTSRPINLHTVGQLTLDPSNEHIALSFYYQARGNGDPPEFNDSLIVDFYRPIAPLDTSGGLKRDTAWKKVWFVAGTTNSNTNDSAFKRVFIRITDTAYFHSGFKFRFRNWASPTGNFDHWHVDYIFLDRLRGDSLIDTVRRDITFGTIPTPFLRDYAEMPYQQYDTTEMGTNLNVRIRNNAGDCTTNMTYEYTVTYDTHASILSHYSGGYDNLWPFIKNTCTTPPVYGYSKTPAFAHPLIKDRFHLPPPPHIRFNYEIKHFIYLNANSPGGSDVIKQNDTVYQYQYFRDFYALDDGSAEAGYYVNAPLAKIAIKIRTNVTDTLKSFRIYFDPVGNTQVISNTLTSVYNFVMNVWAADGPNGSPGTLLYKDTVNHPAYLPYGFKEIPEFKFKNPLVLNPGTYYTGIQQSAATITIGYDRNYNHNTGLYFDAGAGWTQSTENGSLMLHPVFTNRIIETVGLNELSFSEKNKFSVYPNPSSDAFTIISPLIDNTSYQLFNSMGQLIKEEKIEYTQQSVSTTSIDQGIYILILKNKGQAVQQQKIIIQR